jgi:hypothetical protein
MPSWDNLRKQFEAQQDDSAKLQWLEANIASSLAAISAIRQDRNVIFYASAFLQKPQVPQVTTMITMEDINGLMSVMQGMDCGKISH